MDFNILNNWLTLFAAGAGAVLFWLLRSVYARLSILEESQSEFELYCAKTYVTSNALEKALDNLNATIGAIFAKLERIEDKLDLKADK